MSRRKQPSIIMSHQNHTIDCCGSKVSKVSKVLPNMKNKLFLQLVFILIIIGVLLSSAVFSQDGSVAALDSQLDSPFVAVLTPVVFYNAINACESAGFELLVTNPFSEQDTYDFSVESFEGSDNETFISVINPSVVVLSPGESASVSINVSLEDCTLTGRLPVVFVAESRSFNDAVEIELVLDVSAQGVPLVAPETRNILTNFSKNVASLSVLNAGTASARYAVQLVGEPWMRLGQGSLQLGAGEEKSLNLIFEPQEGIAERKYNATVILTDSSTKKQFRKKLVVQLQSVPFARKIMQNALRFGSIIFLILVVLFSFLKSYFWYASPEQRHARLVAAEMRAQAREQAREKQIARKAQSQERLNKLKLHMDHHAG